MTGITVLKIGGSIITDRSSHIPKALPDQINRIAEEIAGSYDNLILVHGAGSFGHIFAKQFRLTERFDTRGLIKTHCSVKKLNNMMINALSSAGVPGVPVHPFGNCLLENGRINEMFTSHIKVMLDQELVPVLHGDVVMDTVKGIDILSGDQIISYIADKLGADKIGVGSNTEGVLDDLGITIPAITPDTFDKICMYITGSSNTDVTGGMLGKVQELVELADTVNIESWIFNAATPGNIRKFLEGISIGTHIRTDT